MNEEITDEELYELIKEDLKEEEQPKIIKQKSTQPSVLPNQQTEQQLGEEAIVLEEESELTPISQKTEQAQKVVDKKIDMLKEGTTAEEQKVAKEQIIANTDQHVLPVEELVVKGEQKREYEIEEAIAEEREVFVFSGNKGSGKSYLAFSFPGSKVVIAFDNKAASCKKFNYSNDKSLFIVDGNKYNKYTSKEQITLAAAETYKYINYILDTIEGREIDWIIIDNFEVLTRIMENTARYYNKLQPFGGTGQIGWKLWDERNFYLKQIFNRCFSIAKKGVIYTLYMKVVETLVKEGQIIEKREQPKWVESVFYETDTAFEAIKDLKTGKFRVQVLTSKDNKRFPIGLQFDVTNKSLFEALK